MGKLEYNGHTHRWEGGFDTEEEFFRVFMSDETFRSYFHAFLESRGISTQSYLESMAEVERVSRQQYEAMQEFTADVERWRDCKDSGVRIFAQRYRRNVEAVIDKETKATYQ